MLEIKALPPEILSILLFPASNAPEIKRTVDTAKLIETVKIPAYARQISARAKAIKV